LSSMLLYSNNKNLMSLSYIQINEEKVNSSSVLLIALIVSITFFLIFYL